jgi:putative membrane protein
VKRASRLVPIAFFALMISAAPALAAEVKTGGETKLSDQDKEFIKDAASGGMMEVELSKIAAQRGSSEQVKDFGRRMQEDHGKANKELTQIAKNKAVDVPKELERKHKSTLDRLSKLSGNEFDREYMKVMLDAHKEDLKKFESEAEKGQDPQVKEFAKKHVPVLKKHLELAEKTSKQAGAAQKDSSSKK